jgi:hypothetical protein
LKAGETTSIYLTDEEEVKVEVPVTGESEELPTEEEVVEEVVEKEEVAEEVVEEKEEK